MKRKIIITLLAITVLLVGLFACGKADDIEPVMSSAIETDDQQEVEEENIVAEVENIIKEEPEQEVEEVDTIEPEQTAQETEPDPEPVEESTGIVIVEELDQTLYAQTNSNGRSGDGTNFDIITTVEKGANLHVTGLTENDWYRVQWGDGEIYISSSLLSTTPPFTDTDNTGEGTNETTADNWTPNYSADSPTDPNYANSLFGNPGSLDGKDLQHHSGGEGLTAH